MSNGPAGAGGLSADAVLAAVIQSTDDAVLTVDMQGRILTWNPGAEVLYGYGADEMTGNSISVLAPDGAEGLDLAGLRHTGLSMSHRQAERRRKDGSAVTVGETVSPIRDANGEVVALVSIGHDISERVAFERALSMAKVELETKNRLLERSNRDLEQFAYVASHDLSEPLRAVAGMVALLERRYRGRLDEDADEFIAFAIEGCNRMRAMIEDLLAYSRAGRVQLRLASVDLEEVMRQVLDDYATSIAETGADVSVERMPTLTADRNQMVQLMQNLLSNALKFTRPDRAPKVEISAQRLDDAWMISVADNGIGIEPQYRQRVQRMFQRLHTRDAYPGTGIGLAIAERVVGRHGGDLSIADTAGGGTTFSFTIPDRIEIFDDPHAHADPPR